MQQNAMERRMDAVAYDLEIRVEAAAEASEIAKRGMRGASKEAEVKSASAKASGNFSDSVSLAGTSSAATAASTTVSAFGRAPNSTSSVVGIARISGYTLVIIML